MFAVELKFEAKTARDPESQTVAISSLVAAFVRNENLREEFLVHKGVGEWFAYGIAPARDAFRASNWNQIVRQRMHALAGAGLKRPQIRFLGVVPDTVSACECAKPEGFYLFTTFLHTEPPLRCLSCSGIVPLYRIPRNKTREHAAVLDWKSNYRACDTLQMNCGVGERFGTRQMSDPMSELSRSGLKVCKEIQDLTNCPTYYFLHRASGRSRAAEARRKCPICGGPWLLEAPLHGKFDFKCDHCRVLSNVAWNVR